MYPTISHLLFDLFNIKIPLPIQTFGFWVAMSFIVAAWLLSKELKRKEEEGKVHSTIKKVFIGQKLKNSEILSSLITGFLLGFKGIEAVFYYSDLVSKKLALAYLCLWHHNKKNSI